MAADVIAAPRSCGAAREMARLWCFCADWRAPVDAGQEAAAAEVMAELLCRLFGIHWTPLPPVVENCNPGFGGE